MRTYYFDVHQVSRKKGESAIGFSSYLSAQALKSERDGKTYDKGHKGVVYSEVMLPPHVPKEFSNREHLWNSVENYENRKDSMLAYQFLIFLDFDLPLNEMIGMVREYLSENFIKKGMICDFAIHEPDDASKSYHVHMLCPTREMDENGQWKIRYVNKTMTLSSGKTTSFDYETNNWRSKTALLEWRDAWEKICNRHLAARGLELIGRCSPKKLGFTHVKQIRESLQVKTMEKKGYRTDVRRMNEWIEDVNYRNRNLFLEEDRIRKRIEELEHELSESKPPEPTILDYYNAYLDYVYETDPERYSILKQSTRPEVSFISRHGHESSEWLEAISNERYRILNQITYSERKKKPLEDSLK